MDPNFDEASLSLYGAVLNEELDKPKTKSNDQNEAKASKEYLK